MIENSENYNYDIQVRDSLINVEGYEAKKIYSYMKEKNGFVRYEDDAVQLPLEPTQRLEVLNMLTRFLSLNLQEIIVDSEYQQDYKEKIAPKINTIDYKIRALVKNNDAEFAVDILEDLTCDLANFKHHIYEEDMKKESQL